MTSVERLVLVHGSVRNGDVSFAAQRPLADELELIVLNRPGFPPGPLAGRVDFEEHAARVAERLRRATTSVATLMAASSPSTRPRGPTDSRR